VNFRLDVAQEASQKP